MSYSYIIQAQVWDHMTALEEKLTPKAPATPVLTLDSATRYSGAMQVHPC